MEAVAPLPSPTAETLQTLRAPMKLPGEGARALPTGHAELDAVLPDGGFPRGAVIEVASLHGLGQGTCLLSRLCAQAQREACLRGGEPAWCAWLDPSASLFAPGVASLGVILERLLVVRPPVEALARVATRLVASRVFSVVVIDTVGVPGAALPTPLARWSTAVRRLALVAEGGDCCVVLLSDQDRSRAARLPVALRIEVDQREPYLLGVHVVKDRRGRLTGPRELAYCGLPFAPSSRPGSTATVHPTPDRVPVLQRAG